MVITPDSRYYYVTPLDASNMSKTTYLVSPTKKTQTSSGSDLLDSFYRTVQTNSQSAICLPNEPVVDITHGLSTADTLRVEVRRYQEKTASTPVEKTPQSLAVKRLNATLKLDRAMT